MIYGSVCSGIEAATCAWHPLGWKPAFFSEIEAFPRALLTHHYPTVPLHGDFTTIKAGEYEPIDLLVGGTPCQDFSVAGLRAGLAGGRGNLTLEFIRLVDRLRPKWVVWENVPGTLSQDEGRAFGAILGALGELGYGFAHRVFDAQYFGLAQRRERLFVVANLRDWRRAAAVLFEQQSLRGDSPPRRSQSQEIAGTIGGSSQSGGFRTTDLDNHGAYDVCAEPTPILEAGARTGASTTDKRAGIGIGDPGDPGDPMYTLQSGKQHAIAFNARQDPCPGAITGALDRDGTSHAVAFDADISKPLLAGGNSNNPLDEPIVFESRFVRNGRGAPEFICPPLKAESGQTSKGDSAPLLGSSSGVRRLTPKEWERLQGFDDDYTLVPWRNGMAADGPRYKAIGNSMPVPVMKWIGERIAMVDKL